METFIILCGKYIQDNKYKILSESAWFRRRCDKNIWCVVLVRSSNCCSLTKRERLVSQGIVATLLSWAGTRLNYCIANLFRTMCTKFYQNPLGFVQGITKTFWCVFRFTVYTVYKLSSALFRREFVNIFTRGSQVCTISCRYPTYLSPKLRPQPHAFSHHSTVGDNATATANYCRLVYPVSSFNVNKSGCGSSSASRCIESVSVMNWSIAPEQPNASHRQQSTELR